jgi:hypothetical protein
MEVAIMAARLIYFLMIIAFIPGWVYAAPEALTDSRMTAEVILDGMTHFDADQGLKDYKVKILEVTRETAKTDVTQRDKVFYFMAPNVYLTMVGDKPETLSNDASFMLLLSQYELKREPDVEVRGEQCYKVIATPRDSAYKKYTKTYYVNKTDFHKTRIESIRSEMQYEFIKYQIDFYYKEFEQGGSKILLVDKSEAVAYDNKGNVIMEQTNSYSSYEFNIGLTQSFFEGILKGYNTYFSEGT